MNIARSMRKPCITVKMWRRFCSTHTAHRQGRDLTHHRGALDRFGGGVYGMGIGAAE